MNIGKNVYKKVLPKICIPFNSEKGKHLLTHSLMNGTLIKKGNLECYFPLSEQFITQLSPSTCGTSTLVINLKLIN